jgi:hypothetical protein
VESLTSCCRSRADPSSVEEPCIGVVFLDLLCEHLGIAHGVKGKEGLCETRRKGGLRLGDALLSTSHLGSVARDEMVHSLLGAELGDGWQDTTCIAGEEDNVLGVLVGDARNLGVLNVLDGVCAASVLGQGVVVVVDQTGHGVENNVFEDGTETDGVENIRLLLGRETNALGVAASLDVEDTSVTPAVLIVTNEGALGIGRERGFACTRQAKEDSNIAILTFVCRGVQGEDIVLDRHLIEENRENTLEVTSALSCICSARDYIPFSFLQRTQYRG